MNFKWWSVRLLALAAVLCFAPAAGAQSGQWDVYGPIESTKVGTAMAGFRAAENWINETCKPDHIGDVTSFFSQLGRSTPWNVYVFCKHGNGATKVVATEYIYPQADLNVRDFITQAFEGRSVSIIGIYAGERNAIYYFQKLQRPLSEAKPN